MSDEAEQERAALVSQVGVDGGAHRVLSDYLAERHGWARWPPPEDGSPAALLRHLLELAPWPEARLAAAHLALARLVLPLWQAAHAEDTLLADALEAPSVGNAQRLQMRHETLQEERWEQEREWTAAEVLAFEALEVVLRAVEPRATVDDRGEFAWAASRRVGEVLARADGVEAEHDPDDPFDRPEVDIGDERWRMLLGRVLAELDVLD